MPSPHKPLLASILIPVRDDSGQLETCLAGLASQADPSGYEVVLVDDGSRVAVSPDRWRDHVPSIRVIRQERLGVAAARNRGIEEAEGEIIVFVDSDVLVGPDFLTRVMRAVDENPGDAAFQIGLSSGRGNLTERMEGLRLRATLRTVVRPDGHIAYANTSAFAIRKASLPAGRDVFDPGAVRGEDTLLLAWQLRHGMTPRLIDGGRVIHSPRMGWISYLLKHFKIGYYSAPAHAALREATSGVLMEGENRRQVLSGMLADAAGDLRELAAFCLVLAAHGFERVGRSFHRMFGLRSGRSQVISLPADTVRQDELVARIVANARRGTGMKLTYLTAWTLVQGRKDPAMRGLFEKFDICYPDGMGVVLSSILVDGRRLHKVTANEFISTLLDQAAREKLPLALVGASESGITGASRRLIEQHPDLRIVGCSHGYLSETDERDLLEKLREWQPRLLIIGMGQPLQEEWVLRNSGILPHAVFLCVGGLFDYITGLKPTPPRLVRRWGMEWLYILAMRPSRFWRRYVIGLPLLASYILKERLLPAKHAGKPQGS